MSMFHGDQTPPLCAFGFSSSFSESISHEAGAQWLLTRLSKASELERSTCCFSSVGISSAHQHAWLLNSRGSHLYSCIL